MNGIIAVIQARIGSARLPAKVLLNLEGKTVLERVIERVNNSKFIKEVIVATTISKEDLEIVNLCSKIGVRVYCGSGNDVLDRYFQVARLLSARHIVRITADCPLIDPEVMDRVIKLHLKERADYTSNTINETFPDGEDVEVITFQALKKSWENAKLSFEREHVTAYIRKHPELFRHVNLSYAKDISGKRWTLDEKSDYRFIKLIYKNLYKKNKIFGMKEILELLDEHPAYEKINHKIIRNTGYLKSLKWENRKVYIKRQKK